MRRRNFIKMITAAAAAVMVPLAITGFGEPSVEDIIGVRVDIDDPAKRWMQLIYGSDIQFTPSRSVMLMDVNRSNTITKESLERFKKEWNKLYRSIDSHKYVIPGVTCERKFPLIRYTARLRGTVKAG